MSDLGQQLARLGISQYLEVFIAEGFDTWETILDITESDLSSLNVKLGHRRKLQRAIAESRGKSLDIPLSTALQSTVISEGPNRSGDESAPEGKGKQREKPTAGATATGITTKRKYRRHPKSDEHAPERPPSAYVIFSNHVRELLKGQDLSFTEIAKVVGERWQVLPSEEREACERQANSAKEKYYAELSDYKKTPQYDTYQKYLEDFRAKHVVPTKEGKRSKIEAVTYPSSRSNSHEQHDRGANIRFGSMQPEPTSGSRKSSEASPTIGTAYPPSGVPSFPSKPTSPATLPLSSLHSPRAGDHYSPISASPRSALFDPITTIVPRDTRSVQDLNIVYHSHPTASTTPPSHSLASRFQSTQDYAPRRSMRENIILPPLTHEDTTLSSESGHSGSGYSYAPPGYPGAVLPLDPSKNTRMLPQPVPSNGPSASPLDRPLAPTLGSQLPSQPPDYRTQGSLAALVRAGELASRIVEDDGMDLERSP